MRKAKRNNSKPFKNIIYGYTIKKMRKFYYTRKIFNHYKEIIMI